MLTAELQRLYGNMRIWVTEYGYQTNPPDTFFGVSNAKQALYMKQAWTKLVANPKVDMMIWFLLRDESRVGAGWQSGLTYVSGVKKPSYNVFKQPAGVAQAPQCPNDARRSASASSTRWPSRST